MGKQFTYGGRVTHEAKEYCGCGRELLMQYKAENKIVCSECFRKYLSKNKKG